MLQAASGEGGRCTHRSPLKSGGRSLKATNRGCPLVMGGLHLLALPSCRSGIGGVGKRGFGAVSGPGTIQDVTKAAKHPGTAAGPKPKYSMQLVPPQLRGRWGAGLGDLNTPCGAGRGGGGDSWVSHAALGCS